MKLTKRGWLVLAAVATAIVSALLFGPRGLNAIAAPGLVALAAAALQVRRLSGPTLEREAPRNGNRGETVPVRLHFDVETPFSGFVTDEVGQGLSATGNERITTVESGPFEYDLHLDQRGERTVGPAYIEAQDVLGLVSESMRYPVRHQVLVRPRVYLLSGPARDDLVRLYGGAGDDRQQFNHLREYERGDPLRDIHWKSSAKQSEPEFVVKEFTTDEGAQVIELAVECSAGGDDLMADAAASIAMDLLDGGVRVGLTTPSGRIAPDGGADHRSEVLDHLARARSGRLPQRARNRADVLVTATPDGADVEMETRSCRFVELVGAGVDATPAERAAAGEEPASIDAGDEDDDGGDGGDGGGDAGGPDRRMLGAEVVGG